MLQPGAFSPNGPSLEPQTGLHVCVHVYVCMCVCIYIYIYIYIFSFAAVVTSPVARLAHEFKSTRWRLLALALWAEQ